MPLDEISVAGHYVKTNKNDANDAEAICEAVRRPNMRFVAIKSRQQQAILTLHRTRALFSRQRAATVTAIKAFLAEFGIVVAIRSIGTRDALKHIADLSSNELPELARLSLSVLVEHYRAADVRLKECRKLIDRWHKTNPQCQLLETIPGIGTLAATSLVATVGDARQFKSGRQMAAWLGLVPRQKSSGERQSLGRISKRGDVYLRRLFVIGAMALMRIGERSKHNIVHWALRLAKRKRFMLAAVALANKIARIAWAVLSRRTAFSESFSGSGRECATS